MNSILVLREPAPPQIKQEQEPLQRSEEAAGSSSLVVKTEDQENREAEPVASSSTATEHTAGTVDSTDQSL